MFHNISNDDWKRVTKTENDTIVFTYQGLNVLFEKDLNTGVVTMRFYANGLQVAKMVGSTVWYLHQDHLGSIRFVSSSAGAGMFRTNYFPYGPQYGTTGTPDEFLFAGKTYDGNIGFYFFGGRFYDPTMGRFITQDSSPGVREDPQSFARYVYARDNPLKIVDPNGHDWWSGIANAITSFASSVTNAWNSLPAPSRDAFIIAGAIAVTIATAGAAAPAILAAGALIGATSTGVYAASTHSSGGTPTGGGLLDNFALGFGFGVAGMVLPDEEIEATQQISRREASSFNKYVGMLGEDVVGEQTGGISQYRLEGIRADWFVPDSRAAIEVKVGQVAPGVQNSPQLNAYARALNTGRADSAIYYFLKSPRTGLTGPTQSFLDKMTAAGVKAVYWDYDWWEGCQ